MTPSDKIALTSLIFSLLALLVSYLSYRKTKQMKNSELRILFAKTHDEVISKDKACQEAFIELESSRLNLLAAIGKTESGDRVKADNLFAQIESKLSNIMLQPKPNEQHLKALSLEELELEIRKLNNTSVKLGSILRTLNSELEKDNLERSEHREDRRIVQQFRL